MGNHYNLKELKIKMEAFGEMIPMNRSLIRWKGSAKTLE